MAEERADKTKTVSITPENRRLYWMANLRIILSLLAVWFFVSFFLGILIVEPLNEFHIGGFPLGFWFAQQGSIYVFIVLILIYCVLMQKLDKKYGVDEESEK